jgi:DnaK suppressor protein
MNDFKKYMEQSHEVEIDKKVIFIEAGYDPRNDNDEYMNIKQRGFFKKVLIDWFETLKNDSSETIENISSEDVDRRSIDEIDIANIERELVHKLRNSDRKRKLMHRIEETISKINLDTYGFCEESGEEIGINRLLARPITKYCIAVQEKKEENEKDFEGIEYNNDSDDDGDLDVG